MTYYCGDDCHALCDFCKHYDFNGVGRPAVYVGEGFCELHGVQMDPDQSCEDFHCGMPAPQDATARTAATTE